MKCHFVYSVPFVPRSFSERVGRKVRRVLQECGLGVRVVATRQPRAADLACWPVRSPYENTKHIYAALSRKCPTVLYHLTERVRCDIGPEDVFLGHPFFPHKTGGEGVTERVIRGRVRPKRVALITPLHCDTEIKTDHINGDFLADIDSLMPRTDVLFGIMGEYWWDRWDTSQFRHWKSKMVRLDMAVDVTRYPRVKRRFNRRGERRFLYIGPNSNRKGTDFLSQLMGRLPGFKCGWIGSGPDIPNVHRIAESRSLDPSFMMEIAQEYDIFVSPSRADPNPTTILESMAWGFPVASTLESGYYPTSYRRRIYLDDLEKSEAALEELQALGDDELTEMSELARTVVETEYTWARFTGTISDVLGL